MSGTETKRSGARVRGGADSGGGGVSVGGGKVPGPGWRAALEILGESGLGIVRLWSSVGLDGTGGDGFGEEIEKEVWPELGYELRLGSRWRVYGRCGAAVRLLREAGRRERPRSK
jgi:hypothetical protein